MKIDDSTLIAYLDAQLEDDTAYEAVEDALAASPALRARLQALAETGELARKAFDAKLEEAVPPQLIEAIMNAPLSGAETHPTTEHPASAATPPPAPPGSLVSLTLNSQRPFGCSARNEGLATPANAPRGVSAPLDASKPNAWMPGCSGAA